MGSAALMIINFLFEKRGIGSGQVLTDFTSEAELRHMLVSVSENSALVLIFKTTETSTAAVNVLLGQIGKVANYLVRFKSFPLDSCRDTSGGDL